MAYGDDPHQAGLMTAGQFSGQTLLSAKALRIYAERGLLLPHFVDPINGYRYYAPAQVPTGWLISLLRSAELSLEQIRLIITTDPESALGLIEQAAVAIERRSEAVQAVLHQARLRLLQEVDMSHVSTTLEGDRPVLSVMKRMRPEDMDDIIASTVRRLRQLATAAGLTATGDPFGVFHAPITADSDGPLEIALPVDDLADTNDDVRSYRLPGGMMANRHAEGPETSFPEILGLYDELHSWITNAGRVPVGPPRETWHNLPTDPEPLRLTISWPYATPASQPSERQG
jgi:DNA-binding transcriptional MerR regulator